MTDSVFSSVARVPKDAMFDLRAQYLADNAATKVNLGPGAYRDDSGQPWVLPSVAEARKRLGRSNLDHEYLPILGLTELRKSACQLVMGKALYDTNSLQIASCQSLSGTGGLSLVGLLLRNCTPLRPTIWIPEPTWSNHQLVFGNIGFQCQTFKYFDFETRSIDMQAYRKMLETFEPGSIIVIHACAHNPTGCDPSQTEWRQIGEIMKRRQLFPLFDAAYLGFNSGSVDEDAYALRIFVGELGMEAAVCVSFAKSMGLYGERVGCTLVATKSAERAVVVETMLERLQRATVSTPPAYGAKIASMILKSQDLMDMWSNDLTTMCGRITDMRQALHDLLVVNGAPGDWKHIVSQTGMFSFLGLSPEDVKILKERYHIYMADNSRISIAGLNSSNVAYVANAIVEVLQKSPQATGGVVQSML